MATAGRRRAQPLSLRARGVALLAQRDHSVVELRRKLLRIAKAAAQVRAAEGAPTATDVNAAHAECEAFADDSEATTVEGEGEVEVEVEVDAVITWLLAQGYLNESRFVESRVHARAQRFGARRIEQELAQHGLSMDTEQRQQLAAGELDRACALLQRKATGREHQDPAAQAKLLRFLVGRGFGPDIARRALRQHLATALESAEHDGMSAPPLRDTPLDD